MPPEEEDLNSDKITQLIDILKTHNSDLYTSLISLVGASEASFETFLARYQSEQKQHDADLKDILKASEGVNSHLERDLDNFISEFTQYAEKHHRNSDDISNLTSNLASEMQKRISKIQTNLGKLGNATNLSISNMTSLISNLSTQYSSMAKASKVAIKTATLDSSQVGGRSVANGLIVEVSNVGDFNSAISDETKKLGDLDTKLERSGNYANAEHESIKKDQLTASRSLGEMEGRKLAEEATQDMNGNFMDMRKTVEKTEEAFKSMRKYMTDGTSHLARQADFSQDIATLTAKRVTSLAAVDRQGKGLNLGNGLELTGLKGQADNLKGMLDLLKSGAVESTRIGQLLNSAGQDGASLLEQQKAADAYLKDNASVVQENRKELMDLAKESAVLRDKLQNIKPGTEKFKEFTSDLDDIRGAMSILGDDIAKYDSVKLIKVGIDEQILNRNVLTDLEDELQNLEAEEVNIDVNMSALDEYQDLLTRLADPDILVHQSEIKRVVDKVQGQGFKVGGGGPSGFAGGLSSADYAAESKSLANQKDDLLKMKTDVGQQKEDAVQKAAASSERILGAIRGTVDQTRENLKNTDKSLENLKKGQAIHDQAVKTGVWSDSIIKQLDTYKDKILDVVGSIPVMGEALKTTLEKPLNEVNDKIQDIVVDGIGGMAKEIAQQSKDGTLSVSAKMGIIKDGFKDMGKQISGLTSMLTGLFSPAIIGAGILFVLVGLAISRFLELDKAAEDFRREVGLGRDQTAEIEDVARNVNVEFQKFGISLEHAFHAAGALTSQFGTLVMATRENVELVALLAENHAVSTANAAGALDVLSRVGDGTAESARSAMHLATGMAKAAGVPLDKVMEDVAGASDETLALIRGSTKELIHASVEARRLGVSLESLSGAASHMLDFESSIRSEMEASVFAGRHLSFAKSRQLAFEGDIVGMQKASLETIKQAGEWTEMSYFQQKKLAEAAGMTVGEIGTQLTREKQLEALKHGTAEQQKMYNRYMQMQSDLQEGNNKSLEQQGEEMIKQELMQSKMNELKDRFKAIMTELGEKLLPLVEIGFSLLVPIVSALFEAAKLVLMPFTLLSDIVRALTGDFSGLSERFGSFGDIAYTTLGLIIGSVVLLNTKLLGMGPLIGKLGTGISGMFTGGKKALEGLTKGLDDFFFGGETGATSLGSKMRTMFDGLSKKVTGMFSSDDAVKGATKKAKDKIKSTVADKAKDVAEDVAQEKVTDSISSGIPGGGGGGGSGDHSDSEQSAGFASRAIEAFNEIDFKKVLQAAGALLIISGALWVSAKAFQEFGLVTWDGVMKGVTALGTMVGSLVVMSKVLNGSMADLLKASAALALVGAALLPAAYAFDMFADVNWGGVVMGAVAMGLLLASVAALGVVMDTGVGAGVILAGAAAIAILGAALIPAAYAMDIMSTAFRNYVDALNTLEWSSIGKILVLSLVFTAVGTLAPFIMMGAYAMMVLSGAIAILAAGVWVLSDGLSVLGPAIVSLGDSAGSLVAFAGAVALIGYFSPSIIAGAWALGALGLAMIPVAAASVLVGYGLSLIADAVSKLSDTNLVGLVLEMGTAFGLLGLMAPAILFGAAALTVMTIALIPFSIALLTAGAGMALFGLGLQMTMDSLKDAPEAAAGLMAFVGAVSLIAMLAPLVVIGAVALGILGVGLAILAVPLLVVSAAMWVLGGAMKLMGDAIETMADADAIGIIFGLGAAFVFLAFTFPLIAVGAIAMTLMTMSLLPLSAAMFMAGMGMKMLTDGIQNLKPALESLSGSGPALQEFLETVAQIALFAPAFLFAGIALTIFGVGAAFAGYAMMLLALGLELVAPPLANITESMVPVIDGLARLAEVGGGMIAAAIGVGMLGVALGVLGMAMVAFSALSWVADGDEIIEQFIRLGHVGPELETASKALKIFGEATNSIGDVGGSLEDIADGMGDIFEAVEDAPSGISKKMEEIGTGMKGLLSAFGPEFLAFSVVADLEDPLESLGDGIEELFDSLGDVDISIAPNFSIIADGMSSLLDAFSGGAMLELNDDVEDILEGLGDGIGEFFEGLEDVDPALIPTLGMIGPGISQLLLALGTDGLADFDTDLEDVFEGLGDGIGEFMDSIEGFDADQIMAMSGMGEAVAKILEGLGGVGEIDFDADDFEDILEGVGSGVESLFEPMRNMDDDLLEAARSVGGVLSGLFSNLGTIGEVGDDWDDVFEGFGEGLESMFDEINDIDRKDLKMAVLVGDVMSDLFSAFEGVNLTEDLGDAVETLGEGIYELFDEIEEVDEEAMAMASSVGRAISSLFKNLPLDAMNKINADTIGDQLNELGYGIYELFYEMDATDFEDQLELMTKVGVGIQQVVIPIIETDLSAIPKDVGDILNELGDGIYNLFDEMDDLGGEEETLELMSGMGGFGQLLSGVAAISDTRVDMTALQEVADSMRMIISAVSSIYDEIEDEDDSMSSAVASVSSGPTEGTIQGLVERMKGLGQGVRSMIDGFGDIDLLKELASLDVGGLLSGMVNAVSGLTQLVNPETFGKEFESESEASDYFAHLAVRMSLLGQGVSSIIGAFSDIDTLTALGEIDFDDIMEDMEYGIKSMMRLTEWGWYTGDEQEETDYYDQISQRMQSLGTGMQSIISAFSDIDTLKGLSDLDVDGIADDMADALQNMMDLVDINNWWSGFESEEDATKHMSEISQRMQSLGAGMKSIIGSFTNIGSFDGVDIEEISENMVDGISAMLDGIDSIDLGAIPSIYEIAPAVKALVGSMEGVADLNNVDVEDVMDGMSEGIENMMDTMGDIEPESISKFVKLSEAMAAMSLSGSGIDVAFDGIKSLASQDFVDGLSRATSAIYDFAYALLALNNVDEVDGNIVSTDGGIGDTTPQTSGVFDTKSDQSTTDFDQLARYSGGAFGRSAGEANTPLVVETLANVGQSGGSTDMSNVEAKLSELIGLMKSGGIAVNLDGKKVHKGLASSIESNPIS